jgi:peptide/nickel transport system substrate-binding protein
VKRNLLPFVRSLLLILAFTLMSFRVFAQEEGTTVTDQRYPVPESFSESPMLAEQVAAGELPPLEERLPVEPFVVGPGVLNSEEFMDWEVGNFGGTIRVSNQNGTSQELGIIQASSILRAPDQSTTDPLPALVSSYSINADYSEYTLTIREGLKWSDGVPVTTEDVRMTFELYGDTRFSSSFPTELKTQGAGNGTPGALTIVDELTFTITFDKPYGQFLAELASWIPAYSLLFRPAHYIKQFHADYTPMEEIQPVMDELEIDTWENLVTLKNISHWDLARDYAIGIPTLAPWMVEESSTSLYRLVRNPYYWKVDINGNQLPYVDTIVAENTPELQTMILKAAAGEYDVLTQLAQLKDMPLYTENAEASNVCSVLTGSINNPPLLFLNHDFEYDVEGSVWQQLVTDPRFGSALAYAIDKDDVNENLYFGLFDTNGLTKESYDPDAANALLDELGMSGRDGEGFRTNPNGERFELMITTASIQPDFVPLGELLKTYFEAVGIRTTFDVIEGDLFDERMNANELMATIHWSDGPIWASGISQDYTPQNKGHWAPMSYQYWVSNGASGRQPPAYIQEFFDLHVARKVVPPGTPEGQAAWAEVENWFATNYATIWPTGKITKPELYNCDLRNVPKEGYTEDRALDYGMEQLFYVNPEAH